MDDEEIIYVVADVPEGVELAPDTPYSITGLNTNTPEITVGEGDAAKTIKVAHSETISTTIIVQQDTKEDAGAHVVAVSNNELS